MGIKFDTREIRRLNWALEGTANRVKTNNCLMAIGRRRAFLLFSSKSLN